MKKRGLAIGVAALFAVAGGSMLLLTRAAVDASGAVRNANGKCLGVTNGRYVNGNGVGLYTCNGSAAQTWTVAGDGTIRNNGFCLDVAGQGVVQQTPVWIWTCVGNDAQQWLPQPDGSLVNPASNLCLDNKNGSSAEGNGLWLWGCVANTAQRFTLPVAPNPEPATASDLIDEFNGPLSDYWTFENPGTTSGYTFANSRFNLRAAAGSDQWTNANKAPRLLKAQPTSTSWTVETRVAANNGGPNSLAGLAVFKDTANWLQWGQLGNGTLEGSGLINNAFTNQFTSMANKFEYLRIRKMNNIWYFDASVDGRVWNNANTYEDKTGALNDARIGLMAKNWSTTAATVQYDYYREYNIDKMPSKLAANSGASTALVSKQTGWDAINDTRKANFCGTDLGEMFKWMNRTYTVFGDTNRCDGKSWPSNVMSFTTDKTGADGIKYDGWVNNGGELFAEEPGNVTAIPTDGIGIGTSAYIYYMNVNNWNPPQPTKWTCTSASIASASNNNHSAWTKRQGSINWGGNSNFAVVAAHQVGSDVYVWGTTCGRFGSVKLMKVPASSVLTKSAYRYLSGYDNVGNPAWSTNEAAAISVAGGPAGELSVTYNTWLGRYVMTYLDERKAAIVMRESPTPWGSWGAPVTLTTSAKYPQLYGAFMDPQFVDNNGETVYWMMSQFGPYNTYLMKTTLTKQ